MNRLVEIFMPVIINGNTTNYLISDAGRVKNIKTNKILKFRLNNKGYPMVTLSINGKSKPYTIHRLLAIAFIPNPNNLPEVNHKDSITTHCWFENLEWCDRKYNMQYSVLYGNANMSCAPETIRMICKILESNELDIDSISKTYNVDKEIIYRILRGKYKTISKDYDLTKYTKVKLKRKVDDKIVHNICIMIQNNEKCLKDIAKENCVRYSYVKDILYKKSRRDISDQYDFSNFNKYIYGNQYKQNMSR